MERFPVRRSQAGFTLVDVVLGTLMASMVILGLAAIYSSVYRTLIQGFKKDIIQQGVLMSSQSIAHDLAASTHIKTPESPCPNGICPNNTCPAGPGPCAENELVGCTNYDPISNALIDPNSAMRVYRYCVNGQDMWYTWIDTGVAISCAVSGACDSSTPGLGWLTVKVSSMVFHDPSYPAYFFRRPPNVTNVVELKYKIETSTVNMVVTTAMPLISPNP